MKKILLNSFYILVVFFVFTRCASISKDKNLGKTETEFEKIALGDEEKKLQNLFGTGESSFEVYPGVQYKVFSYNKSNGEPDLFFTVDPTSNRVIGKSRWVNRTDKVFSLETFLNTEFKGIHFKAYIPCRTRSENDKILVNSDLGLYLATENNQVVLISYAESKLLNLRVGLIQKNCPSIQ